MVLLGETVGGNSASLSPYVDGTGDSIQFAPTGADIFHLEPNDPQCAIVFGTSSMCDCTAPVAPYKR